MASRLSSYEEFWPYYVSEHMEATTRRLHVLGTSLVLAALVAGVLVDPLWLIAAPFFGYGFAWVGHFFFEHNRPATFTYPVYSFIGDWAMFRDMLTGRIRW
jgi:hypothetical protein